MSRSKLFVALLLLTALASSTTANARSVLSSAPRTVPPAIPKAGTPGLLALLAYVPERILAEPKDSPEWTVHWFDLKQFEKATGTVLATSGDRSKLLSDGDNRLYIPEFLANGAALQNDLGISQGDASSALSMRYAKFACMVFRGKFDEADLTTAMGPSVGGVWSIGPDKDYKFDVKAATELRLLGEGLRLTKRSDALIVSPSRAVVEAARDPSERSMADLSPWREVAAAIDAAGAYSATLGNHPSPSPKYEGQSLPLLERTTAIGLGFMKTKAIAVYSHDSESKARTNQKRIAKQFRDGPSMARGKISSYVAVDSVTRRGSMVTVIFTLLPGGTSELRSALLTGSTGFGTK
jgi:hypothetical protein